MTWLLDALRRLGSRPIAVAGLALLISVTALMATAGPRLFTRVARDSVQASITAIPATDREVVLSQTDILQGSAPAFADLAAIDAKGQRLLGTLPIGEPPTYSPPIFGTPIAVVETPSYRALEGTASTAELRLRLMEQVDQHVHLTAGRAPTDAVGAIPDPLHSTGVDGTRPQIPLYEVEVSASAAEKLGLQLGSTVVMGADPLLDPLSGGGAVGAQVVGIYVPNELADPYWQADDRVTAYGLRDFSANVTFVQATFLVSPDLYPTLATGRVNHSTTSGGLTIAPPGLRIAWRFAADPTAVNPDNLDWLVGALRRLQTVYPTIARAPSDVVLSTSLLRQLVALQGPWQAAGALLSVASIGAVAVALASLALVVLLTAEERRRVLLIQRERGASAVQALVGNLAEGLLVALPAGAIGMGIAIVALPGDDGLSLVAGGFVVLAAVVLQLGVVLGAILGPPRLPIRARAIVRGVPLRRLVLDAVIVGLAIVVAYALRQRGLQGAGGAPVSGASGVTEVTSSAGTGGTDPLLAAAPVLVGIAAAIVAIRIAPYPLAALAWLASRGRTFGPVLAARRAARDAGAGRVLLIVLAIASLGAFASATVVELQGTARLQSWQDIGAPYRIDASSDALGGGTFLPADVVTAGLPGASEVIPAHISPFSLSTGGQRELVAIDLERYDAMLGASPVALTLPPQLTAAAAGSGTPDAPLPALVSTATSGPFPTPAVGSVFQISFSSQPVTFRVAAIVDAFPGLPAGESFVIASWPQIDAAAPNRLLEATNAFVAAPAGDAAALSATVRASVATAVVRDRATEEASLADQGVVRVVSIGVAALAGIALLYAALAVVAAFVLTAAARADEAAHLSTLGLSERQSSWMLVVEFGPPVILAVLAGVGLGLGLFAFLAPGLGLTTIVGALQAAPAAVDPGQVGLLALLITGILGLGVALGAPAQRRAAWASVRRGLR